MVKKIKATLISAAQSMQKEVKEIRGRDLTPVNTFQFFTAVQPTLSDSWHGKIDV